MIALFIIGILLGIVGLLMSIFGSNEEAPIRGGGIVLICLGFVAFFSSFVSCVPAGYIGVQTQFGDVQEGTLHEGLNWKAPWINVHNMSLRQQRQSSNLNASTNTGVTIDVGMTVVYRMDPSAATTIYQTIGEDYYPVLIEPFINRTVKNIFVSYPPEAIYTVDRATVNMIIEDSLRTLLAPHGIIIEQVPIDNIDLPVSLRDAIIAKQEAEQAALQMEYVLQRQTQESERMRIEAQGIADYQETVSSTLSETLLQWQAIKATEALASSDNTTFVILGNNEGLPIFFQPGE